MIIKKKNAVKIAVGLVLMVLAATLKMAMPTRTNNVNEQKIYY